MNQQVANSRMPPPMPDRRGAIFPIALIQISITGILLGIGGVCLHTALRSDRQERQSILLLQTITRLEQQLRADERHSRSTTAANAALLTFSGAEKTPVHSTTTWRSDRGVVERLEGDLSAPHARETYIFPAGYAVEFANEPASVVVRIREGLPTLKYREAPSGGLARGADVTNIGTGRVIEIRLQHSPGAAE